MRRVLHVICHVLHIACHLSPFTYHLSVTPRATATDPPPANFPTKHSRLVHINPKKLKKNQNPKKEKEIFQKKILLKVFQY